MAVNEKLVDTIRELIADIPCIKERYMFGAVCFMLNNKMCIGVLKDEIMCRLDPILEEQILEKTGCRPLDITGKSMKGFICIGEEVLKTKMDFEYWINLCLEYNPRAKASRKKKTRQKIQKLY